MTTTAKESDLHQLPRLLHGKERLVHGDRGYLSHEAAHFTDAERRATKSGPPRARVERPFHVIKWLWGFAKVRYWGLAKNTARMFALLALANLYLVRRQFLSQGT